MALNLIKNGDQFCKEYTFVIPNDSGVDKLISDLSINFDSPIDAGVDIISTTAGNLTGQGVSLGDITCQGKLGTEVINGQEVQCPIENKCEVTLKVCFEITDIEQLTNIITVGGNWSYTDCDGAGNVDLEPFQVKYDDCSCILECVPPETVTTIVDNGNGTFTYTNEAGEEVTITVNEIDMDFISLLVAGSVVTFTSEDGTTSSLDICDIVANNCNATLVDNGDGTLTFTDNAGNTNTVQSAKSTFTSNGDGTATHDDGTGNTFTVCEICPTLIANPDGSYSFTGADGVVVKFDTTSYFPTTFQEIWDGTQNDYTLSAPPAGCTYNTDGQNPFGVYANGSRQALGPNIPFNHSYQYIVNADGSVTITPDKMWGEITDPCVMIFEASLTCI